LTLSAPVRRLLVLPLTVLAAVALLACTSSGDGGTGLTDDFLESGALFESDTTPAGGSADPWVGLTQSVDQRTVFCLDVDAYRVSDLYSVAFTLTYDSNQADLRSYSVGDLLIGDFAESDLLVSVDGSSDGLVLVGLTRKLEVHQMEGVSTTGGDPGHLIQLCFDIFGEGTERGVNFIPNLALEDFDGNSLGAVEWIDGVLTTRL